MMKKCDLLEINNHLVRNYGQLIDLVGQIKDSRGKSRTQICADLESWWVGIRVRDGAAAANWEKVQQQENFLFPSNLDNLLRSDRLCDL